MPPAAETTRDRPVTRSTRAITEIISPTPQRSLRSNHQIPKVKEMVTTSPRSLRTIYTPSPRPQTDRVEPPLDPLTPRNSGSRCRPPPRSLRRSRSRTTSQTFGIPTPDRPQSRPSYHDPLGQLITPSRLTSDIKFTPLFSTTTSPHGLDPQDSTGCNISHPVFSCNTTSYQPKSDPFDPFSNLRGEAKLWSGSFPIRFDTDYPRAVTPQDVMRFSGLATAEESPLFYQPMEYVPPPQYINSATVHPAVLHSPRSEFASQSSRSDIMLSDLDLGIDGSSSTLTPKIEPELEVYFSFSPLIKDSFGTTPVSAYFQAARISESRDVDVDVDLRGGGGSSWFGDVGMDPETEGETDFMLNKAEEDTDVKMDPVWGSMSRNPEDGNGDEALIQSQGDEMSEGVDQRGANALKDFVDEIGAVKMETPEQQVIPLDPPAVKGLVDYPSPTPSPMSTASDHQDQALNLSSEDIPLRCLVRQDAMHPEDIALLTLVEPELEMNEEADMGSLEGEKALPLTTSMQLERVPGYEIPAGSGTGSPLSNAQVFEQTVAPGERNALDTPTEAEADPSQMELSSATFKQSEAVPTPGVRPARQVTDEEELRAMLLRVPDKRYPSRRWPSFTPSAPSSSERRPGAAFLAPAEAAGSELPRLRPALKRKRKPQPLRLKTSSQNSVTISPTATPKVDKEKFATDTVVEMDQQDLSDAESELTPLPEDELS